MTACDVTVIIPNYNRTALLKRALSSIMAQTLLPYEVIIVDDCSEAQKLREILDIVQQCRKTLNITMLLNNQNRGANYSRNKGISAAASKYVAFLDSDDLWMPEKLSRQFDHIAKAKAADSRPVLSATGRYRVNSAGNIIARQFGGKPLNAEKIRRSNFIGTLSSVVVETWIARHIHGFNEDLSACQDWDFFIRLADYVNYVGVPEPLCIYADHGQERITLDNRKRLKSHLFIYRKYIRDQSDLSRAYLNEFYRNVAEDYQEIGNYKKANLYYAKHMSLRTNDIARRLIPERFWFCLYRWKDAPLIKMQRYSRYKRMMATLEKKPNQKVQIDRDREIIHRLMHRPFQLSTGGADMSAL